MRVITLATLFLVGCSDIPVENTGIDKLTPEAVVAKGDTFSTVGTSCALGCIWSGYAVSMEAQESTNDCSGIPCVCVEEGNIWNLCETEQEVADIPESYPESEPQAESAGVPYFFQYSNQLYPGSSCQNTSVAMVLAYIGWDGVPDDITSSWGKDYAQSPHNLSSMFNTIASSENLSGRLVTDTNGSLGEFRSLASRGEVLIVHGYFTGYGHVLVVTGFDGVDYTANDPAGVWRGTFKGGYGWSSSVEGHSIEYNKQSFESAIGTSDGYSSLPLWYHVLNR
ncbi:MAG: hypothetical protein CMO97_02145 [Woeseia sp.]|nr:hypothetical protein [Woeseia sp.]|tara:strand:- start:530 stop:1372 length:843 start_codon:yes stop_codon:yes gene_type:complete